MVPRPGLRDALTLGWALAVACFMIWTAIGLRRVA